MAARQQVAERKGWSLNQLFPELEKLLGKAYRLDRSLPDQLEERLRSWIDVQQPGMRLPSERALAKMAGVNRLTLRKAMARLSAGGVIVSTRRGTFINDNASIASSVPQAHPLQTITVPGAAMPATITIALYEQLPWQRSFWQWAGEAYNNAASPGRIRIVWVPADIRTPEDYLAFLHEAKADLALFLPRVAHEFGERGLLAEIPEALFAFEPLLATAPSRWYLPVHATIWLMAWNRSLMPSLSLPHPCSADDLEARLLTEASKASSRCALLALPICIWFAYGAPANPLSWYELRDCVRDLFSRVKRLRPLARRLLETGEAFPSHAASFFDQRVAGIIGQSVFFLGGLAEMPARCECVLPRPLPERRLPASVSSMGIMANANADHLADVLAFFLSAKVQNHIADMGVNAPVIRSAFARFAEPLGWNDSDRTLLAQTQYLEGPDETNGWFWYLRQALATLCSDVLDGRRNVDDELLDEALSRAPFFKGLLIEAKGSS